MFIQHCNSFGLLSIQNIFSSYYALKHVEVNNSDPHQSSKNRVTLNLPETVVVLSSASYRILSMQRALTGLFGHSVYSKSFSFKPICNIDNSQGPRGLWKRNKSPFIYGSDHIRSFRQTLKQQCRVLTMTYLFRQYFSQNCKSALI